MLLDNCKRLQLVGSIPLPSKGEAGFLVDNLLRRLVPLDLQVV